MTLPEGIVAGVYTLGVVLLHFLWQGGAVGLLYWLLRPWFAGVGARYRLGLAALAALTLAPVLTAIYLWPSFASGAVGAPSFSQTLEAVAGTAVTSWKLKPMLPWLVGAWFGGVLLIASHSLWQWRKLMRVVRQAAAPSPEWQARLQRLCARFELHRPVRLLCSAAAVTPMLIGWLKPVILLPTSMLSGFTPEQVELIIAHELGHIRRFDYLINLLQVAVETVLFYHPVVHWISRDVRNAREACCDDLVLQLGNGSALTYAHTLADLEELRLAAPALAASGGVLLARIKRIVGESETLEPLPRSYALPMLLVAAAFASLAWRPQQSMPELAAALKYLPAHTLALFSGNSTLRPQALSIALPVPQIQPPPPASTIRLATPVDAPVPASAKPADAPADVALIAPPVAAPVPPSAPAVEQTSISPVRAVTAADSATVPTTAPLQVVPPVYPQRAKMAGIEGAVQLAYAVDAGGAVSDVRVISARPLGVFEDAAKSALSGWRFPAAAAGERHTQNFAFTLHGHAKGECKEQTGSLICRRPGD